MLYRHTPTTTEQPRPVFLADGSKVWLKGSSHLAHPAAFGGQTRPAILRGEAYLMICRNENAPFVVTVADLQIETLSALFHIREEEKDTRVTVFYGVLKVLHQKSFAMVAPRQQLLLKADGLFSFIRDADIDKTIDWMQVGD